MNVLVCGSSGYLGHHVVSELGHCTAYDNLTYVSDYLQPIDFVRGDVTDYVKLQPLLDEADTVVWLAAIVGDGACMVNPTRAIAVNQGAVKYLATHYDGRIIFTSTASVYGISDGVATVDTPLNPISLYAETKINAEKYLGIKENTLILRLGTLHGVSARMRFDLVVNRMTLDAVQTGVINVFGGHQYRPLLSVKDAAKVIVSQAYGSEVGTYNLASENLSIQDVAGIVQEVTGAEIHVTESAHEDNRNYRIEYGGEFGELRHRVADSVQEIAELVRSGRLRDPYAAHYSNTMMLKGGNT
jgi:nucleoside-diphosphate-sugar epimerase